MADRDEEQLLSGLLRSIETSDRHLDAAELESRVLAAWDAQVAAAPVTARISVGTRYVLCGAAAAALIAVVWTATRSGASVEPLPVVRPVTYRMAPIDSPIEVPVEAAIVRLPIPQSPIAQAEIAQSPVAQSPAEFMPLMPLAGRELSGSFQIVRVQMPRASLGALVSPLEYPSELVEADVLLGQDGLARAIRLSPGGSVYPRRFR